MVKFSMFSINKVCKKTIRRKEQNEFTQSYDVNKVKVIKVCILSRSAFKTTINLDFLATVLIRLININRIGLIKIPHDYIPKALVLNTCVKYKISLYHSH